MTDLMEQVQTEPVVPVRRCWAENLAFAQVKVDKVNKRAKRLGLDARMRLEVLDRKMIPVSDGMFSAQAEEVTYRVTGDDIVLPGGWVFLAALTPTQAGNVIRTSPAAPDVEVPAWARTVEPRCGFCNTVRRRKDTYLLVNEAGDFKQVGSSCLVDFLGITPAQVGWIFDGVAGDDDDDNPIPRGDSSLDLQQFLTVVATLIRTVGWVPRSAAGFDRTATADAAISAFLGIPSEERRALFASVTDEDARTADQAIAWARSDGFTKDVTGEYGWNLKVIASDDRLNLRNTGYAASIVSGWLRQTERLAKFAARVAGSTSTFIGQPKDKVTISVRITGVQTFDGDFGLRLLVKMITTDGNEVVTWTSPSTAFGNFASKVDAGKGEVFEVKGTVKDQKTFAGVAQTTLVRVARI